jgi:hypothetical protein
MSLVLRWRAARAPRLECQFALSSALVQHIRQPIPASTICFAATCFGRGRGRVSATPPRGVQQLNENARRPWRATGGDRRSRSDLIGLSRVAPHPPRGTISRHSLWPPGYSAERWADEPPPFAHPARLVNGPLSGSGSANRYLAPSMERDERGRGRRPRGGRKESGDEGSRFPLRRFGDGRGRAWRKAWTARGSSSSTATLIRPSS